MKKMFKLTLLFMLAAIMILALIACGNRRTLDLVYTFDVAIVRLPDGTIIQGKCDNWRDYSDSDQMQVEIDGKVYLTHASCVTLIQN